MDRIYARDGIVNNGRMEVQFTGKNLTSVGGMKLFHKFTEKLGVEEALSLQNDFIEQPLARYRVHDESATQKISCSPLRKTSK